MENHCTILIQDTHLVHDEYRNFLCPKSAGTPHQHVALNGQSLNKSVSTTHQKNSLRDSAFQGQEGCENVTAPRWLKEPYMHVFLNKQKPQGGENLESTTYLREGDPNLQVAIRSYFLDDNWIQSTAHVGIHENVGTLKIPFVIVGKMEGSSRDISQNGKGKTYTRWLLGSNTLLTPTNKKEVS